MVTHSLLWQQSQHVLRRLFYVPESPVWNWDCVPAQEHDKPKHKLQNLIILMNNTASGTAQWHPIWIDIFVPACPRVVEGGGVAELGARVVEKAYRLILAIASPLQTLVVLHLFKDPSFTQIFILLGSYLYVFVNMCWEFCGCLYYNKFWVCSITVAWDQNYVRTLCDTVWSSTWQGGLLHWKIDKNWIEGALG